MGSISGWMSTPSAAVYAAAKAGVVRFGESVNIELEVAGVDNRILDVSPASFKGSKFYGGKNDLSITGPLVEEIVERLFARDARFIPRYEETFIPFEERLAIIGTCQYVDKAVKSCREDSDAWDLWHYDRLFAGSDYKGSERFQRYEEYFVDKGVEIVYFPYTQSASSTQIRKAVLLKTKNIKIEESEK